MLKNTRQIKYKNDTLEMIAETARRMNVSPGTIRKAFSCFWQDIDIMFTHNLGYGIKVERFCDLVMHVQGIDRYCKKLEPKLMMVHRIVDIYLGKLAPHNPEKMPEGLKEKCRRINDYVTRIVMLDCSARLYEKEVLGVYPKKYRPKRAFLDGLIRRLEEFYHLPLAEFPVQVYHPIQEIFVRRLQKDGLLPNPVFYKDQEVHLLRLHYRSKNGVPEVQLPFTFLDQAS